MRTQCEQIIAHLKQRRTITSMMAFRLYAISRLPDRVRDCRRKGVTIYAEMIRLPSGKRVAQYSL
jgi:hypothetical protein